MAKTIITITTARPAPFVNAALFFIESAPAGRPVR
jgi:hypothetical protein